jgi:hypothetical protein
MPTEPSVRSVRSRCDQRLAANRGTGDALSIALVSQMSVPAYSITTYVIPMP